MALNQSEALKLIYACLGEINSERTADSHLKEAPDTGLLGSSGELDSLELVNLVVRLEALLADRLDRAVVLVDERAFDGGHQPFRTVATLASYLVEKARLAA
jgi:acyl carrier protein